MDTHSMIFVTIDKLVSPSSSVNGDPLDDSADHWQPRFSAKFPRCRTSEGADWPAPPNERSLRSQLDAFTNGLGDSRFRCSRDRFVAQLLFSSNPVLDIFPVFAAALKIQLMSPASDLFSRWFSESNHCNLLGCQDGAGGADRPPYVKCGLLAVR